MLKKGMPVNRELQAKLGQAAERTLIAHGWLRVEAGGQVMFRRPESSRRYLPADALKAHLGEKGV